MQFIKKKVRNKIKNYLLFLLNMILMLEIPVFGNDSGRGFSIGNYFKVPESHEQIYPNFSINVDGKTYFFTLGIYGPRTNKDNKNLFNFEQLSEISTQKVTQIDSIVPPKVTSMTWEDTPKEVLHEILVQGIVAMQMNRGWGSRRQELSPSEVRQSVEKDLNTPGTFAHSRKQLFYKYLSSTVAYVVHPTTMEFDDRAQIKWVIDRTVPLEGLLFSWVDRRKDSKLVNINSLAPINDLLPMEDPIDGLKTSAYKDIYTSSNNKLTLEPRHYFALKGPSLTEYLLSKYESTFVVRNYRTTELNTAKLNKTILSLKKEVAKMIAMGICDFTRFLELETGLPSWLINIASYTEKGTIGESLYKKFLNPRGSYGGCGKGDCQYVTKEYVEMSEPIIWVPTGGNLHSMKVHFLERTKSHKMITYGTKKPGEYDFNFYILEKRGETEYYEGAHHKVLVSRRTDLLSEDGRVFVYLELEEPIVLFEQTLNRLNLVMNPSGITNFNLNETHLKKQWIISSTDLSFDGEIEFSPEFAAKFQDFKPQKETSLKSPSHLNRCEKSFNYSP